MFRSVVGEDQVVRCNINFEVEEILVHELFEQEWTKWPNKEAVVDSKSGVVLTYGELLVQVKALAAHLQADGVLEGKVVAFTATNSLRSCLTLLALVFCKCTIIIPKNSLTAFEIGELLRDIPVSAAFGDRISSEKFRAFQKQQQNEKSNMQQEQQQQIQVSLKKVYCIDDEDYLDTPSAVKSYVSPQHSDPKKTILFLAFTSGSTGPSKAVQASHFNFVANVYPFYDRYWTPDMVQLVTSPASHLSGLLTILLPLARAEKIVVASEHLKADLASFADVVQRYKVTKCLAMPVTLNTFVNASPDIRRKLQGLRVILTGGSVTQEAILQRMTESFPDVSYFGNLYGMSETFGIVSQSQHAYREGLGLHVQPNMSMKVVDVDSGQVLPANEQGEIWLRGPTLSKGYLNNANATEAAFLDGWLRTGDIGFYDDLGRFSIVDRIKEMIKCLDSQIAPSDIEAVILRNGLVESALVLGVPDNKYGEAPTAFIVPKNFVRNLTTLREDITADIREKCAVHKQLYGGIFFLSDLAKTDTGKFSRKDLLKAHLERKLPYLKL